METCKFLYKGINYETKILVVNDSIVLYDDQAIEKLLADLDALPNLVTYQHRNGLIEYFDNRESLMSVLPDIVAREEKELEIETPLHMDSRKVANPACDPNFDGNWANLFLCDDDNYGGKVRHIYLPTNENEVVVDHLKPNLDMNDKTTAFCAYSINGSTFFELFENDHLKSHCLSFTCYKSGTQVINIWNYQDPKSFATSRDFEFQIYGEVLAPDLKNVHVAGTKKSSWNDRITSVRITRL